MVETRARSRQAAKDEAEHQDAAHGDKYHGQGEDSSSSEYLSSAESDISYTPSDAAGTMSKTDAVPKANAMPQANSVPKIDTYALKPAKKEKKTKRRDPPNDDDLTAFHPWQTGWSIDNLPDILYVLRPEGPHPRIMGSPTKTPYLIFGRNVADFPVLPLQISSRVEGWRYEAWFRLDRRITAEDIIHRINPKYRVTAGELQMRRYRFREAFHLGCWGSGPSMGAVTRLLEVNGLDPRLNSTRGLTPGLINPYLGERGGRIPLPRDWVNVDTVDHLDTGQRLLVLHPDQHRSIAFPGKEPEDEVVPAKKIEAKTEEVKPDILSFPSTSYAQPLSMRSLSSAQRLYDNFPEYPDPEECELAHYDHSPSRVFKKEPDEKHMTTTLEEYLQRNNISYEKHIERYNTPCRQKRPRPMLSLVKDEEVTGCTSLSKRLRRSIEGPLKSADSDMDDTASEILGKFKGAH
ncbi:hypothetical protein Plec18170_006470 [Paecilomyces lecythidis]